jgi:hypothetical protein
MYLTVDYLYMSHYVNMDLTRTNWLENKRFINRLRIP